MYIYSYAPTGLGCGYIGSYTAQKGSTMMFLVWLLDFLHFKIMHSNSDTIQFITSRNLISNSTAFLSLIFVKKLLEYGVFSSDFLSNIPSISICFDLLDWDPHMAYTRLLLKELDTRPPTVHALEWHCQDPLIMCWIITVFPLFLVREVS